MTKNTYIFGTGKLATDGEASEPAPVHDGAPVGGFAMPDTTAMAADTPDEPGADPDFEPDLMVLDDGSGHNPYDTQTLPTLGDEVAFPDFKAQRKHNSSGGQDGGQSRLNAIQALSQDLSVTGFDEDGDPYNNTGRFEARNIWRKVMRK